MADLPEVAKLGFQHGYLIAVSTMLHQHGCTVTAEDALRDGGFTLELAESLGLDEFDMQVLRPVLRDMKRNAALQRNRRP